MFKLLKTKSSLPGSSHLESLPGLSCSKIAKKFGEEAAMRDQVDNRYSTPLVFKMNGRSIYYTLYMRQGEWRVGGNPNDILANAYLKQFIKFIMSA